MSEEMKDSKEIAKQLITKAGKKKSITYKDIIETLEKCQLEANQIEKIYEELEAANIDIIEDSDEPNFEDLEDIEEEIKEKAEEAVTNEIIEDMTEEIAEETVEETAAAEEATIVFESEEPAVESKFNNISSLFE